MFVYHFQLKSLAGILLCTLRGYISRTRIDNLIKLLTQFQSLLIYLCLCLSVYRLNKQLVNIPTRPGLLAVVADVSMEMAGSPAVRRVR